MMPRAMDHPQYRYQPWSDDRKQAASARAKARVAEARAANVISAHDVLSGINQMIAEHSSLLERMEEVACALRYIKRTFPDQADEIEAAYVRIEKVLGW